MFLGAYELRLEDPREATVNLVFAPTSADDWRSEGVVVCYVLTLPDSSRSARVSLEVDGLVVRVGWCRSFAHGVTVIYPRCYFAPSS